MKVKAKESKNTIDLDFESNLRCICWLNQKLVHHHAHLLSVEKMPRGSDVMASGAKTVTNIAMSQNALTQCALNVVYCHKEFVEKWLNDKPLNETLRTSLKKTQNQKVFL